MYHDAFDASKDAKKEGAERVDEPWWKWRDSLPCFEGETSSIVCHERWVLDGGKPLGLSVIPWEHAPRGLTDREGDDLYERAQG